MENVLDEPKSPLPPWADALVKFWPIVVSSVMLCGALFTSGINTSRDILEIKQYGTLRDDKQDASYQAMLLATTDQNKILERMVTLNEQLEKRVSNLEARQRP